jgi:hypothetical protein
VKATAKTLDSKSSFLWPAYEITIQCENILNITAVCGRNKTSKWLITKMEVQIPPAL